MNLAMIYVETSVIPFTENVLGEPNPLLRVRNPFWSETQEGFLAELIPILPGTRNDGVLISSLRRLLARMQQQLLHTPVQQFADVNFVFRRARDFVNPSELFH